jgi:hypothetical protein
MGIIIVVVILIAIVPYIIAGLVLVLGGGIGIGCVVGLPVGIFFGIKNYMSSILQNINNRALKITMMFITSLFIVLVLMYLAAAVYFFINFHGTDFFN